MYTWEILVVLVLLAARRLSKANGAALAHRDEHNSGEHQPTQMFQRLSPARWCAGEQRMHVSGERNATIFWLNRVSPSRGLQSRRCAEFLQKRLAGNCLNAGESDSKVRFCLPFSVILGENSTTARNEYVRTTAGWICPETGGFAVFGKSAGNWLDFGIRDSAMCREAECS